MGARVALGTLVSVLGLVTLLPASASACSCAPGNPAEAIAAGERAVIAKLVEVRVGEGAEYGYAPAVFIYKLRRVFSGPDRLRSRRRLRVHSNNQGSACGLPQRHPKRYGLFLDRDRRGRLISSLCAVTSPRSMRRAAREVEEGSRLTASLAATGCSARPV